MHFSKTFENVPISHLDAVKDSFTNAPTEILNIIERTSDKLNIASCRCKLNSSGMFVTETPHYSEKYNVIRMDNNKDPEEYAITFRHEYGHFADAQLGRPSMNELFEQAITADFDWYNPESNIGKDNLCDMLSELEQNESMLQSRYFSDILSGMLHNEGLVIDTYLDNNMGYYSHSNSYWDGITGPPKAKEREIFANLFAIYTENNSSVVDFVERFLPNTTSRFKSMIGGKVA